MKMITMCPNLQDIAKAAKRGTSVTINAYLRKWPTLSEINNLSLYLMNQKEKNRLNLELAEGRKQIGD